MSFSKSGPAGPCEIAKIDARHGAAELASPIDPRVLFLSLALWLSSGLEVMRDAAGLFVDGAGILGRLCLPGRRPRTALQRGRRAAFRTRRLWPCPTEFSSIPGYEAG